MAEGKVSIAELKERRINLLIALGEQAHNSVRKEDGSFTDKMMSISQQIKEVDIQIGNMTYFIDYTSCPKCQTKAEPGTVFCKQCGFGVKEYYAAYVKKCDCCGELMKAEQRFCITCGTKSSEYTGLENVAE